MIWGTVHFVWLFDFHRCVSKRKSQQVADSFFLGAFLRTNQLQLNGLRGWCSWSLLHTCPIHSYPNDFKFTRCGSELRYRSQISISLVQETWTLRPKKDSKVSFKLNLNVLQGLCSLEYFPMITSAGNNSSVSWLIALNGKTFGETFEVTTRGGHLCSGVATAFCVPWFWSTRNHACHSKTVQKYALREKNE